MSVPAERVRLPEHGRHAHELRVLDAGRESRGVVEVLHPESRVTVDDADWADNDGTIAEGEAEGKVQQQVVAVVYEFVFVVVVIEFEFEFRAWDHG